jgi:hypothetical protein
MVGEYGDWRIAVRLFLDPRFDAAASIQDSDDDHVRIPNRECDGDTPLEADDTKSWSNIVTSGTAVRERQEIGTKSLDPANISQSAVTTRAFGDPAKELVKIGLRGLGEEDARRHS